MSQRKSPSKKNVAVIFNLPPQIRSALFRKVKAGSRSKFVAQLLAEKLGVATEETTEKAIPQKKKGVLGRLFRK